MNNDWRRNLKKKLENAKWYLETTIPRAPLMQPLLSSYKLTRSYLPFPCSVMWALLLLSFRDATFWNSTLAFMRHKAHLQKANMKIIYNRKLVNDSEAFGWTQQSRKASTLLFEGTRGQSDTPESGENFKNLTAKVNEKLQVWTNFNENSAIFLKNWKFSRLFC